MLGTLDSLSLLVNGCALLVTLIGAVAGVRKLGALWLTRDLRKVWGIRDKEEVIVVCSELDDPEKRQKVEPREFIYCLKYGDVDAFFEVTATLLRLYPRIRLRVMSSGEAENTRLDLAAHLVVIGGPDYNSMAKRILAKGITRYQYRSPYAGETSAQYPDEIVLYDSVQDREYCELTDEKDYGYFERIRNPNNPDRHIVLIGGCHTVGVTGAMKAFSMADSEHGEIPQIVLKNAKTVSREIQNAPEFAVLVSVERTGQTISVPVIALDKIHGRARDEVDATAQLSHSPVTD